MLACIERIGGASLIFVQQLWRDSVLLADGRIKEGQTFRDLPEDSIRKLSQKPDLLLSKIPKPVNVEVVP